MAPWWRAEVPKHAQIFYDDFPTFLTACWSHLKLPVPTPIQNDIAQYMQMTIDPAYELDRAVIEAFRGIGKSWICGAFVCWLLMRDPQLNIMVVSASKDRSDNFSTFVLQIIREMPMLDGMYPSTEQRSSKIAFDVRAALADHAPSVRSVGVFGQMTGGRADILIADDVEVPNTSDTVGMREKLATRTREFSAILKPHGTILYLGTPQTEESHYNNLPERGYKLRVWTARVPSAQQAKAYGDRLAPMIQVLVNAGDQEGKPTDPLRFDNDDLNKREYDYGKAGFTLQFMLDTTLSDADRFPLKLADLVVVPVLEDKGYEKITWANDRLNIIPDVPLSGFSGDRLYSPMGYARDNHNNVLMREYTGCMMAIDPSGRGKDETAYCVTKVLNSQIYLVDVGAAPGGYTPETLQFLADKCKQWKVNHVTIEPNFGDGMFSELLRPFMTKTHPCEIEEVRSKGQKELRIIDTLEPVMSNHRLVIDVGFAQRDFDSVSRYSGETQKNYRFLYQLTHVTRSKGCLVRDDRLDAVAMSVRYWLEAMGLDADNEVIKEREKLQDEKLAKFMIRARRGSGGSRLAEFDEGEDTWLSH